MHLTTHKILQNLVCMCACVRMTRVPCSRVPAAPTRSSLHTPSTPASQLQVEQKQHPNNRNNSQPSYCTMLRHCLTIFCALDISLAKELYMFKYRCFAHCTSQSHASRYRHIWVFYSHMCTSYIRHQLYSKESAKHWCALFFNISERDN